MESRKAQQPGLFGENPGAAARQLTRVNEPW